MSGATKRALAEALEHHETGWKGMRLSTNIEDRRDGSDMSTEDLIENARAALARALKDYAESRKGTK